MTTLPTSRLPPPAFCFPLPAPRSLGVVWAASILWLAAYLLPLTASAASYNVTTTDTNAQSAALYARIDANNTFTGTNAFDQVSATNITMRGNITIGRNWISPSGGPSGVWVTAEGALNVGLTNSVYPLCVNASPNDPTAALSTMGLGSYANSGAAFINDAGAANFIFGVLSDTYSVRPVVQFNKYGGSYASIGAVTNAHLLGDVSWVGYDGSARRNNMILRGGVDGAVSSGVVPMYLDLFIGSTGASRGWRWCDDRAMRFYNMTTGPTTGSGYGVIAATNNEVYVWDGAGNRTLLSSENEAGEMIRKTDKPFGGFSETVNLSQLGRMMEDIAKGASDLSKYAGKIYSSNSIPVQDWRANETKAEADAKKEHDAWESVKADYDAKLSAHEMAPENLKAFFPKPEPFDHPEPELRPARQIPIWAVEAQKQFDSKYVEAEK